MDSAYKPEGRAVTAMTTRYQECGLCGEPLYADDEQGRVTVRNVAGTRVTVWAHSECIEAAFNVEDAG